MKKLTFPALIAVMTVSGSADAVLLNGSTLNIGTGSFFVMEVAPSFFLPTTINNNHGLVVGTVQAASASHIGAPDGTENPGIDAPWSFFGNTGMHFTSTPVNILSAGGNTATLDFSGWRVTWNGIPSINMGAGAWNRASMGWAGNTNGVAQITCGMDCGNGDTFSLQYTARVPVGDPSSFGGVGYGFKINGTISAVPVPAAVWLLGSGLAGLIGLGRRRRGASVPTESCREDVA